jgi:hypothetical protein
MSQFDREPRPNLLSNKLKKFIAAATLLPLLINTFPLPRISGDLNWWIFLESRNHNIPGTSFDAAVKLHPMSFGLHLGITHHRWVDTDTNPNDYDAFVFDMGAAHFSGKTVPTVTGPGFVKVFYDEEPFDFFRVW